MAESLGIRIKRVTGRVTRIMLVTLILVMGGIFAFWYWGVYDQGVRAGNVLRISKKGVLFKTYEGQLNLQTFGALKDVSPIMESFDFSVESGEDQIIKDLEQVALTGERVNLHYIKRYRAFPWRGDTRYFITKVERLQPK